MSTYHYIHANDDDRLTLEQLQSIAKERAFNLELVPDPPSSWAVELDDEWVHLHFQNDKLVGFERFGANDPTWFVELMEEYEEFDVYSEHDEEFEDLYYSINR